MSHEVVVTGIGAVTPIGHDKDSYFRGLLNGAEGIAAYSKVDYPGHVFLKNEVNLCGKIKDFNYETHFNGAEIAQYDQHTLLILKAVKEALTDAKLSGFQDKRGAVLVGTAVGLRPPYQRLQSNLKAYATGDRQFLSKDQYYPSFAMELFTETVVEAICKTYGVKNYAFGFNCICTSGSIGIGLGYDLISSGIADSVICVGFDFFHPRQNSVFSHFKLISLDKCRPFGKNSAGFQLGESVGVAVLEKADLAKERDVRIYAKVEGYGATCDACHMVITSPTGDEYAEAIKIALRNSRVSPSEVDYIAPVGRGGKASDTKEAQGFKKALGQELKRIPMNSIVPNIGYVLGANTILNFITTLLQMKQQKIFPTLNGQATDPKYDVNLVTEVLSDRVISKALVSGFAFTGINSAIVVSQYQF